MKHLLWNLALVAVFPITLAKADPFKIKGSSAEDCQGGGKLTLQLTEIYNDVALNAVVTRVSPDPDDAKKTIEKEVGKLKVYPQLPDDPEAEYTFYRGETGTLFELKMFQKDQTCIDKTCNAILTWASLGEGVPVHMMVEADFGIPPEAKPSKTSAR